MGRPVKKTIITEVFIHPATGGTELITRQKGSRRYNCADNGNDVFTLVANDSPLAGQAYMLAYDSDNNVYFVTKLTRHHALVYRKELVGVAYQFTNGQTVQWDPWNNAVQNVSVVVENNN